MKKIFIIMGFVVFETVTPLQKLEAQIDIATIIKAAVKKVIKAVDLQIQRFQNKTIWLQNVQKSLENAMSKTKLYGNKCLGGKATNTL